MLTNKSRTASGLFGRDEEIEALHQAFFRSAGVIVDDGDDDLKVRSFETRASIILSSTSSEHDHHHSSSSSSSSSSQAKMQEFVFLHGSSGSGKTSLANTLRYKVEQCSGFFLSGKFEFLTAVQRPYAAFASAFEEFVDELFINNVNHNDGKTTRLDEIRTVIQDALGTEGELITAKIPSLELLIGKQQMKSSFDDDSLQGSYCINSIRRFQFLFCKLCRAISSVVPLVFFIDDIQWSDMGSLQLLRALLLLHHQQPAPPSGPNNSRTSAYSGLLIIAACRDEALQQQHPAGCQTSFSRGSMISITSFMQELEGIHSSSSSTSSNDNRINLTKIHLGDLDESAIGQLVAAYVGVESELWSVKLLASEVHAECHGSPFHALQILKARRADGATKNENGTFEHDDSKCIMEHPFSDESLSSALVVHDLVRRRLKDLPEYALQVLQVSACLGDEIDESAVPMILDDKEWTTIHQATKIAADHGHLTLDPQRGLYRFSHDQIRQAVVSTIEDIDSFSFHIGYTLWKKSTPLFLSSKMFVIATLLNHGSRFLFTDQAERYRAAAFNLEAGIKAASMANFTDSSRYLTAGIDLLKASGDGDDSWVERYDLTLNLFHAAADTEVCTQNFGRVMELVQQVLDNARTLHDKIPARVAQINSLCQSGSTQMAINIGIKVLQQLGEPFPQNATKGAIIREMIMTRLSLFASSGSDLMSRRHMEDKDKLHAMHLLAILLPYAFQARSFYNPLMASRMVRMCVKHGFHKHGVMGLVTFAWVTCIHDRREGYRLGLQALSMVERLRAKEMIPRVSTSFYGFTCYWRRPVRETLEPLKQTAAAAMVIGDVECAMWALFIRCVHLLVCATPLAQLVHEFEETIQMKLYKQDHILQLMNITHQYIHNLMGKARDPTAVVGEIVRPGDDVCESSDAVLARFIVISTEANLSYKFGEYLRAADLNDTRRRLNYQHFASFNSCNVQHLEALIAISCVRLGHEKRQNYKIARKSLNKLKSWAVDCPENFSWMHKMVEAELRSLKGQQYYGANVRNKKLYDESITEATKEGFTQQAALACELAGDYMKRGGDLGLAREYWTQAHSMYSSWGATAKATHLLKSTGLVLV